MFTQENFWVPCSLPVGTSVINSGVIDTMEFYGSGSSCTFYYVPNINRFFLSW